VHFDSTQIQLSDNIQNKTEEKQNKIKNQIQNIYIRTVENEKNSTQIRENTTKKTTNQNKNNIFFLFFIK
jgi:hypothetical protein